MITIPAQSGAAFTLDAGQTLTVVDPTGEQVGDLVALTRGTPRTWISSGKSIDFAGRIYLTTGDVIYSNLSERMFRIVADTVGRHDFLLAPCSQETFDLLYAGHVGHHPSCFANLASALAPYEVSPGEIPGAFNIFMNVVVTPEGLIDIRPPRSRAGDHIKLLAEQPLIVGLTACSAEMTNNGRLKPIQYEIV